jgi:hypothetical protein
LLLDCAVATEITENLIKNLDEAAAELKSLKAEQSRKVSPPSD